MFVGRVQSQLKFSIFCVIVLKGIVYRSACFNRAIGLQSYSRTTDCILSQDQVVRNMVRVAGKIYTIIELTKAATSHMCHHFQ